MDRARLQAGAETFEPNIFVAKHDFAHGVVVRQHGDDDFAVEELVDIHRRPKTECFEFGHLIAPPDIADDACSGGCKVCGHRRSHVTEADKTDFSDERLVASQFRIASALLGWGLRCIYRGGETRVCLLLGHGNSSSIATASSDAQRRTHPTTWWPATFALVLACRAFKFLAEFRRRYSASTTVVTHSERGSYMPAGIKSNLVIERQFSGV